MRKQDFGTKLRAALKKELKSGYVKVTATDDGHKMIIKNDSLYLANRAKAKSIASELLEKHGIASGNIIVRPDK